LTLIGELGSMKIEESNENNLILDKFFLSDLLEKEYDLRCVFQRSKVGRLVKNRKFEIYHSKKAPKKNSSENDNSLS